MDKAKDKIRKEDIKKRIFVPVSEMPVLTPKKAVRE